MLKYLVFTSMLMLSRYAYTQFTIDTLAMDSAKSINSYQPIEAGFLFSYYEQDGTKSPVTGGIGDEALQDRVMNITLTVPLNKKVGFNFMGGIDVYSSASTDCINNEFGLYAETSASRTDARKYGTTGVVLTNDKRNISYGGGIGLSHEFDVKSYHIYTTFKKQSKNRNTIYFLESSFYWDKWTLFYPDELRWKYHVVKPEKSGEEDEDEDEDDDDGPSDLRKSFNGSLTLEQDITPRMNASVTLGMTYQDGMLSTPFHRVYFNDTYVHDIELLPRHRLKIPLGFHLNYYISKHLITRMFYRYYFDDFGIKAHTASLEIPIKIGDPFMISPFYRYHTQSASTYFKPFGFHSIEDRFYTSDYDLSNIVSNRIGLEIRYAPFINKRKDRKVFMFKKVALRASKYFRLREEELILKSYIVSLSLNFRIE